jgi:hypothetical protein
MMFQTSISLRFYAAAASRKGRERERQRPEFGVPRPARMKQVTNARVSDVPLAEKALGSQGAV